MSRLYALIDHNKMSEHSILKVNTTVHNCSSFQRSTEYYFSNSSVGTTMNIQMFKMGADNGRKDATADGNGASIIDKSSVTAGNNITLTIIY